MSAVLIDLLAQARAAGVVVSRGRDGALLLAAAQHAAAYAMTLREREADVLRLFDWSGAQLGGPMPCRLCGAGALLRDPIDRRPCHKACVDQLLHDDRPGRPRTTRRRSTRRPATTKGTRR